nr:ATP-binding protein [Gloeobacter violaceus]
MDQEAQERLCPNAKHLHFAMEAAHLGVWDWNAQENTVFCSDNVERMLGLAAGTFAGTLEAFLACVHPEDRAPVAAGIAAVLAQKREPHGEFRVVHPVGEVRWLAAQGRLVFGDDGAVVRVLGIVADITERRRTEAELQRQNRRIRLFSDIALKIRQSLQLEDILRTSVDEVQKLLAADRVLIFRLWADGTGKVVQEAVLESWPAALGQNILDPCFRDGYQEQYRRGRIGAIADIETAPIQPCHADFLRRFAVRANLVVPILQREQLWGLLIAHQCSAPRQWSTFETELLLQLADQMGIALAQAQLLEQETQQRRELARSNTDLEQFAYVASHDLQEPLRMIGSYLQLLEQRYQDKLDPDAQEFIGYAVDGARWMQTLINDLLAYSRVGIRAAPPGRIDASAVLENALANLKPTIENSGATVSREALPKVIADATQLAQVFQNLVGNALKFHGPEPPQIHIGAAPAAGEWVFSVADNGIGIEAPYRERIFAVFRRLHPRGGYAGTGIGLAICKKIVERHGGRIWVESQPGRGSTFFFTVPEPTGDL